MGTMCFQRVLLTRRELIVETVGSYVGVVGMNIIFK